ncbi:MAG: hypothetical protein A2832_01540 [Candidatus Zambryskibacteria bacterium RIFCSPHIGHO2_01_FULL_44_22b]|uniref:DoxX family protein n=1 Tax=Candidatus Zambryskibacteria bacterium RIFCSPHIGHO2_01_FULL_44_22b TaxID=1802737 RepID=A0A1G2T376_9BACT|nr:MAG: hypothetical protein A2832_01540 [Candidatus Zambryskibacteria bacterium RIFCSPHIGHO2_01_FULL_44_22b]
MFSENFLMKVLRIVIGVVFIWFGVLKVLGYNPVFELIYNSMAPFLAGGTGLVILGFVEVFIGAMLLSNRSRFFTHLLLVLHLLGTFSTFIFGWDVIFDPYFPILTLAGEFVVKNFILVMSGLVVLVHKPRH